MKSHTISYEKSLMFMNVIYFHFVKLRKNGKNNADIKEKPGIARLNR